MKRITILVLSLTMLLLGACGSIEKLGISMVSDLMAGDESGELFTGDNDPQLVEDALPFILKMYEMLLSKNPNDANLLLATGKTFVMYSNIFIQTPAGMLPDEEYLKQFEMLKRSKNMYRRGVNYIVRGLEVRHPGFIENLEGGRIDEILPSMEKEDVPFLYWGGSGLLGEFSSDPFDFSLGAHVYKPVAMLYRAFELDNEYDKGALHDVLIQVNASLPDALRYQRLETGPSYTASFVKDYYGTRDLVSANDRARHHFNRSIEISGGISAGPYLSFASVVSVNEQNYSEYVDLLNTALAIDPEDNSSMRLAGVIYRERAQWLLDHEGDFFLLDTNE